jgi:hypothetical protein
VTPQTIRVEISPDQLRSLIAERASSLAEGLNSGAIRTKLQAESVIENLRRLAKQIPY